IPPMQASRVDPRRSILKTEREVSVDAEKAKETFLRSGVGAKKLGMLAPCGEKDSRKEASGGCRGTPVPRNASTEVPPPTKVTFGTGSLRSRTPSQSTGMRTLPSASTVPRISWLTPTHGGLGSLHIAW